MQDSNPPVFISCHSPICILHRRPLHFPRMCYARSWSSTFAHDILLQPGNTISHLYQLVISCPLSILNLKILKFGIPGAPVTMETPIRSFTTCMPTSTACLTARVRAVQAAVCLWLCALVLNREQRSPEYCLIGERLFFKLKI